MSACKYLKVSDVKREYGVTTTTVIYWIKTGYNGRKLKALRAGGGGMYLILASDLAEFMEDVTADVK